MRFSKILTSPKIFNLPGRVELGFEQRHQPPVCAVTLKNALADVRNFQDVVVKPVNQEP